MGLTLVLLLFLWLLLGGVGSEVGLLLVLVRACRGAAVFRVPDTFRPLSLPVAGLLHDGMGQTRGFCFPRAQFCARSWGEASKCG